MMTIGEVAQYCHVGRNAIYVAITEKRLVATRTGKRWMVSKREVDTYRVNKYRRDRMIHDGELVFDLDKGYLSVSHVTKIIASALGKPYSTQRIYYLIRTGDLKAMKKRCTWVILKEDAEALLDGELAKIVDSERLTNPMTSLA